MKRAVVLLLALIMCLGSMGFAAFADEAILLGDANGDGDVDNLDASVVLKYDAGIIDLAPEYKLIADVNGDGDIDNLDAANVLKYDAGIYDSVEGPPPYSDALPEATDMNGREFFVLQRWFGYGKETVDFEGEVIWDSSAEDGNMSGINLAKKKVIESVQQDYNCTITGEIMTDTAGNVRTYLQEDMLSGAPTIDFCFETYYYYYSFLENGFLRDLSTLGIDFTKPWWDQNAVKDLSIDGKLYYATGDINTYDNDGTTVVLFNKDLYAEKGGDPDELYRLAKDGIWTFDAFVDEIEGFGYDSDGNGVRDELDTYGLLTETDNLYYHLIASGEKTVKKGSNDCPVFALDSEKVYAVNYDTVELYLNTDDVLVADLEQYKHKYEGQDVYGQTVTGAFKEGRGLFYMTNLQTLYRLKDMADNIGILPVPKYDKEQDRYYHTVDPTGSCVFVPNTTLAVGENGKQIGILLDALGAYSKDYVTPKYYGKRLGSSNADATMLDIVLGSRTYDLGSVFAAAWADPMSICTALDHNIESRVFTYRDIIEISIADSLERIKEGI